MYPILFRIGGFSVYAYGFFIALALVAGGTLLILRVRRLGLDVPFERAVDIFFYSVLSATVGSRALFVVINFEAFRGDPLGALKIWEGGFVFYGGLILASGVAIGYMRHYRMPVWKLADLASPSLALGLFLGRIGCFLAGCCYGKETKVPWGVTFSDPNSLAILNRSLHPTQLYDAANGVALFFILIWMEKRKRFDGQMFWLFVFLYAVSRFLVEIWRGDPRGFFFGGLVSTSQGIGVGLAILSGSMLFFLRKRYRRRSRGGSGDPEISSPGFEEKV